MRCLLGQEPGSTSRHKRASHDEAGLARKVLVITLLMAGIGMFWGGGRASEPECRRLARELQTEPFGNHRAFDPLGPARVAAVGTARDDEGSRRVAITGIQEIGMRGGAAGEGTRGAADDGWARCRARAAAILRRPGIVLPWAFALAFAIADAALGGEAASWVVAGALVVAALMLAAGDNLKFWLVLYPLVFVNARFKLGDWAEGGEKLFGLQLYDPWILWLLCLWVPQVVVTKRLALSRTLKVLLVLLALIGLWAIRIAPSRGLALRNAGRTFFEPLLVFAVIAGLRWTRSEIRAAAGLFAGVAGVVAGISFFGYYSGEGALQQAQGFRLESYWEGTNILAAFLVAAIPVGLGMFLSVRSVKGRLVVLGGLLVQAVALVLSYTRGAWLALAGAMGLMVVLLRRWVWILVAVLLAALVVGAGPPELLERVESIITFQRERSATNRLALWPKIASLIAARPVFGYGFGGFQVLYSRQSEIASLHAHNFLMDFALAIGVPGLLLVLGVIGYALGPALVTAMEALGRSRDAPLLIGLGIGCVGMLAAGMVDGSIPIWPELAHAFWFLLALTYAMTCIVQRELSESGTGPPARAGAR